MSPGREGGPALTPTAVGLLVFLALYVPCVSYLYGRQGRWAGAAGWSLLVAGIAGFGTGVSRAFSWGGLAFLALALGGAILVGVDLITRGRAR